MTEFKKELGTLDSAIEPLRRRAHDLAESEYRELMATLNGAVAVISGIVARHRPPHAK